MIYTYKPNKGPATTIAYRSNQPHFTKHDTCVNVPGKPNPIKQWRKQLAPYVNNYTVQSHPTIQDIDDAVKVQNPTLLNSIVQNSISKGVIDILHTNKCSGIPNSNPCVTGSNAIRRSANTIINKTFCWNSKQYLQSSCKTYDQNQQIGRNISGNKYLSGSCVNKCNLDNNVGVIYKPNNKPFQQQGGVTSSSRIAKLKYDTIRNSTNKYDSLLANLDSSTHILNRKPVNCTQWKVRGNRPYTADCKHIITTGS